MSNTATNLKKSVSSNHKDWEDIKCEVASRRIILAEGGIYPVETEIIFKEQNPTIKLFEDIKKLIRKYVCQIACDAGRINYTESISSICEQADEETYITGGINFLKWEGNWTAGRFVLFGEFDDEEGLPCIKFAWSTSTGKFSSFLGLSAEIAPNLEGIKSLLEEMEKRIE